MRKNKSALFAGITVLSLVFSSLPMTVAYAGEQEAVQQKLDNVEEDNGKEDIVTTVGWSGEITEGSRCYVTDTGEKLIGLQLIDDEFYFFDENGFARTGWQAVEGEEYYFNLETGVMVRNQMILIDGTAYEFDFDGHGLPVEPSEKEDLSSDPESQDTEQEQGDVLEEQTPIDEEEIEISKEDEEKLDGEPTVEKNEAENAVQRSNTVGWFVENGKKYYIMPNGTRWTGWAKFGNTYYYCGSDGALLTGRQKIGGKWYYLTEGQDISSQEYGKRKTGWIEPGDGKKYYAMPDGSFWTGWAKFGSTYYYCGSDAAVVTGIHVIDGVGYEFDKNGVRQKAKPGWHVKDGKKYYAMPDGTYWTGWAKFGSTYYYCGSDAALVTGKEKIGGKWYYFTEGQDINSQEYGKRKTGWIEPGDGKKYYAMPDGSFWTGWAKFGSTYYYCGSDAAIVTGFHVIDGVGYEFDKNGVRQKAKPGWQIKDGKKYYVMPDGTYWTGWAKFGNTYYYCGSDAALVTGRRKIGGRWYYLTEGKDINSQEYGKRKTGWIEPGDGKKYYAMPDGSFWTGWAKFGNTYYYCESDGAIIRGQDYAVNDVLYTFDKNGVRQIKPGWGEYKGKRYYINASTGFPYTGWLKFGNTKYYADKNGFVLSGWQTIDGYRYYFYPSTYQMAANTTIDGVHLASNGRASQAYTYAENVLNQVGWNLSAAYNWSAGLRYQRNTANASPGSEWFATYGFQNGCGNCYVMAATFYYMADLLGYDVHQVSGYVALRNGGRNPHSWCEIDMNGTTYIFDPDFTNETGRNGYQIRYGTSGTWRYTGYYRMN